MLGVVTLLNPVLHHRTVTGELGKIRIYIDGSQSMQMGDPHMALARRAEIARQLDWISGEQTDAAVMTAIDHMANAERLLADAIDEESETPSIDGVLQEFRSAEEFVSPELRPTVARQLIEPLEAFSNAETPDPATLNEVLAECQDLSNQLQREWDRLATRPDSTASMTSLVGQTARWKRIELALTQTETGVLDQLRTKHEVELYALTGEQAQPIVIAANDEDDSAVISFEDIQYSRLTDLSTGILSTQKDVSAVTDDTTDAEPSSAQPNAAIVVISDGNHNAGTTPVQMARIIGSQGVPVYTVSTGAVAGAPDLAVMAVQHPDTVFQSDQVRGELVIRDLVPAGTPFVVQLGSGDTVVWQEELISQNLSERRIGFEFPVESLTEDLDELSATEMTQHAVPLELTASVSTLSDDAQPDNNQRNFRFSVVTKQQKILILDGRPRWETRYLRNVFERDNQWSVTSLIAGPATDNPALPRGTSPDQFPANRDALFDYDLIILGELDADLLNDTEIDWLNDFVQVRGGGLILIDGRQSKLHDLSDRGLDNLIPVKRSPNATGISTTSLQLTEASVQTPVLQLVNGEAENQRFWKIAAGTTFVDSL